MILLDSVMELVRFEIAEDFVFSLLALYLSFVTDNF
jgi:hypothetical protein